MDLGTQKGGEKMKRKILAIVLALMLLVTHALAYTELAKGSKGDEVVTLQEALINQGYLNGKADGDFGKKTEAAVLAFQKANGLPETGVADEATQTAIMSREEDRLSNLVLSSGSTGNDVTKLQNRLIELGYLTGKATGTYDVNTEAAMVVFQAHNGLTANGIADKTARDVLYANDARGINDPAVEAAQAEASATAESSDEAISDNSGLINPEEAFVIERLKLVPEIAVVAAATEEHDPNNLLGKQGGYTAQIYFSSTLISPNAINRTLDQVIDDGTDGGGSIEVYKTAEEAIRREEYLGAYDGTAFSSGSHTVVGSCLIRTSRNLTASQQTALESSIIEALTLDESEAATRAAEMEASAVEEIQPEPTDDESEPTEETSEPEVADSEVVEPEASEPPAEPAEEPTAEAAESVFLFNIPIGAGYTVGEDIQAGTYRVVSTDDLASISIQGSNYYWEYLSLWKRSQEARVVLTDGDTFDVEYASLDVYSAVPFSYDDPNDIVVPTGNCYIVGTDIPAGDYSGYATGENVTLSVYSSPRGDYVSALSLDQGETLGKTTLKEGYAISVQSGTLHLTPYQGLASSGEVSQGEVSDQLLFTIPVGVGYVVGEDIDAGTYVCKNTGDLASISIKGPNYYNDYLSFWSRSDEARVTLMDGDTFDVEYAPVDVYACGDYSYDDPDDIALITGNRYIVGRDIPAGTYSGYAEGSNGTSFVIYTAANGDMVDFINVDAGAQLGKTKLSDGNAITIQNGILHLTPYKGLGG